MCLCLELSVGGALLCMNTSSKSDCAAVAVVRDREFRNFLVTKGSSKPSVSGTVILLLKTVIGNTVKLFCLVPRRTRLCLLSKCQVSHGACV